MEVSMTKSHGLAPLLRSTFTACIALAAATTASAAPTAVSQLPHEFWGKECFGLAPSKSFPGAMWYVLMRFGPDGKKIETWSSYALPGLGSKQSVATSGFKEQAILFTAWGDGFYTVPVMSPKALNSVFIKLIDNQVQFSTAFGVAGKADCEQLP
jgi:hypothetical protein